MVYGKIPWRRKWQPTPVFLLGRIPWTEEPGRLPVHAVAKSRTGLSDFAFIDYSGRKGLHTEHTWFTKVLRLLQNLPVHLNINLLSLFMALILNP